MQDNRLSRRTVLQGIGAAAAVGALGAGAIGSAAAQPALGPRTGTVGTNVFLGGDFFELGIREDGSFGSSNTAPSNFFGSQRGRIGMYADFDGFDAGTNTQGYDYFLPGSPEERFAVGYIPQSAEGDINSAVTGSNGNVAGFQIPITSAVTPSVLGTQLRAQFSNNFDGVLAIDTTYSFDNGNRFFRTDVTIENISDTAVDRVRYQRTVDPDNGVDAGCSFNTKNTIVSQPPTSGEALVQAELLDSDNCSINSLSSIPIFYLSTDSRARVSSGASTTSFPPSPIVYAPEDYDNFQPEGTTNNFDTYMAITFDFGTLQPGESVSFNYFTGLTDNVDDTRSDIGDESPVVEDEDEPASTRGAEFSLVCDRRNCREELFDGNERVELSNDSPVAGEEIELAVTVTNVGDERGTYAGELSDGFRLYGGQRATLEPDEKTTLVYPVTFENAGNYQMFLSGDKIVDVTVRRN
jgi:hypothetical protein